MNQPVRSKQRVFLLLATLLLLVGCQEKPQSGLPTVQMKLGSKTFTLEVANAPETREHGLMQRDSMPADHGMIFVFDDPSNVGFWMKNTRIPLDIVFVDSNGAVISVKQMKPYDLSSTYADGQAKWAIELNKESRKEAIASIERYFRENMEEPIGNIAIRSEFAFDDLYSNRSFEPEVRGEVDSAHATRADFTFNPESTGYELRDIHI